MHFVCFLFIQNMLMNFFFYQKHLSVDTCLSVYEVAALHRCHDLAAEALTMAASQCSKIINQPSFVTAQKDTLLTLLDQPFINVESEEELIDVSEQ